VIRAIIFDASDVLYHHREKDHRMLGCIRNLKSKYLIGMITNLSDSSVDNIFLPDEKSLFNYIHTYGKQGLAKPDPEVFKHSALELGVTPEECVYIDDMQSNLQGAGAAGMQTIVYNDFETFERQLTKILETNE